MRALSALRHGFDSVALVDALSQSLGIIEFDLTGRILRANENFCRAVGYDPSEIVGKHHSIFVAPADAHTSEHKGFWERLAQGEFKAGEFHRVAKGGRDIWIQATYNPVKSSNGTPYKVVKVAADVTKDRLQRVELDGKLSAISRAQAIIEFKPSGEILTANDNFLATLGYSLGEIQGQHHRMFVPPAFAQSAEYLAFWAQLNRGEFIASEFMRIGKGGRAVWIQASYNPVFDPKGQVLKIVKFATDITDRVQAIHEVSTGLGQLAENNLEHRILKPFVTTFEKLRTDFNGSLSTLQSSMQRVAENTQAIQSGANEIAAASDELSRRTEQQAANLEETAAALNGITATVKKSAESAAHAREVVSMANQDAKLSSVTVGQAVNAMQGIAKSAHQISQIIGVIDEIAFQTNLLALNAGVEAARAGDAGRGFAVVASEVRALAQRSAEAAKEIKTLISASGIEVANGVRLVGETGVSLERIMSQVNDINHVVMDIAAAAQEQATGLAEINTAVAQLDQVTQQNAAMAEESTAASQTLSSKAIELGALVSVYQVGRREDHGLIEEKTLAVRKPKTGTAPPGKTAKPAALQRLVANGRPKADANGWEEF